MSRVVSFRLLSLLASWAAGSAFLSPSMSMASAKASGWSIQPTPNKSLPNNVLSAVSCTSKRGCVAVGESDDFHKIVTLAERWNGKKWTIQHTPNPTVSGARARHSVLNDISCVSARACIAVGSADNGAESMALVERWNGRKWTVQRTPSPKGATGTELWGVSCASARACIAVGDSGVAHGSAASEAMFAERWNGRHWTIQQVPNPPGARRSTLSDVSCPAPNACTAIGDSDALGALAERWNGTKWTAQGVPDRSGGTYLVAVSCGAVGACVAVGESDSGYRGQTVTALAERWHGGEWTIQHTPRPNNRGLRAVSCRSASACTATGTTNRSMAERWNGSTWVLQRTPRGRGVASVLNGVSCASTSRCTAVGDYGLNNPHPTGKTLAERWNGG